MGGYLVYCFLYRTVTDFSAAERGWGVKFCMRVGLLSGRVFSPFGEDWLAGSHRGGITLRDHCSHRGYFTGSDGWTVGAALGIADGGVA